MIDMETFPFHTAIIFRFIFDFIHVNTLWVYCTVQMFQMEDRWINM